MALPECDESGRLLKDDWFVFHFDHDHAACCRADLIAAQRCEAIATEIHELCTRDECRPRLFECRIGSSPERRPGACVFHPAGCECSYGACQEAA